MVKFRVFPFKFGETFGSDGLEFYAVSLQRWQKHSSMKSHGFLYLPVSMARLRSRSLYFGNTILLTHSFVDASVV